MNLRRADKKVDELEKEIAALEAEASGKPLEETPPVDNEQGVTEEVVNEPSSPEKPLTKEEETFKKRYGDLRRHSQKKEEELGKRIKALEEQLASKPSADLPTDPERVKEWVKKYPEVAAVIRALASEERVADVTKIETRLKEIEERNEQLSRSEAEIKIKKAHPDFDEITKEDAFHDWVEAQPRNIQDIIYDGDADQVIWGLSLYKKLNKKDDGSEAAKQVKTKSSTAPATDDGKRRFTESQVSAMGIQEYERLEKEIQAAIRSGNFVYDLSGAAR